ncbi:hypothetical protein [Bombiscardovia coagulans]|uniref:Uncharacterized protein n=1 Tax=Bombiscardovia coagulans TaxID=686666 RepID=A0A261ESJ0_9BIFI|nr:hypothetical protein [Bombiscardovia coagulans]OZG49823.1 hypothetical protein BOCO_0340 [Bombiscardovia coagulans]
MYAITDSNGNEILDSDGNVLFGDDQPVTGAELKDSVKEVGFRQPVDGSQRLEMVEDMSPEKGPFGGSSEAAPLLAASGWHPFLHFFVKVANMVHGEANPCDRVRMLSAEHPKFFLFSWIADEFLETIVVAGSVMFICMVVEKTIGVSFPIPFSW